MDYNYNKFVSRNKSLSYHLSCPSLAHENDREYEDFDNIKTEEIQSFEDTLPTIPKETSAGYEFNPHPNIVEQDQLNSYYHISTSADNTSSITNDDNIPAIISHDVILSMNTTSSIESNIINNIMTTTVAQMVAHTRMETAIFPIPCA